MILRFSPHTIMYHFAHFLECLHTHFESHFLHLYLLLHLGIHLGLESSCSLTPIQKQIVIKVIINGLSSFIFINRTQHDFSLGIWFTQPETAVSTHLATGHWCVSRSHVCDIQVVNLKRSLCTPLLLPPSHSTINRYTRASNLQSVMEIIC